MVYLDRFDSDLLKPFADLTRELSGSIISFTTDREPEEERKKYDIILHTDNFGYFTIINVKDSELTVKLGLKKSKKSRKKEALVKRPKGKYKNIR